MTTHEYIKLSIVIGTPAIILGIWIVMMARKWLRIARVDECVRALQADGLDASRCVRCDGSGHAGYTLTWFNARGALVRRAHCPECDGCGIVLLCPNCRHILTMAASDRCPECGWVKPMQIRSKVR